MKRDMDRIRSLLLSIEGGQRSFSTLTKRRAEILGLGDDGILDDEEAAILEHHLDLLKQAGFVEFTVLSGGQWQVHRITWEGHNFLDTHRDPEVWRQTKEGAQKVGSWSLKTLADIAVAIGKARIERLFATGEIGG